MKIAIMQPYIFPYIGYFQLIHAVDKFVFYDDVNFKKKGFINKNTILVDNQAYRFTIPCIGLSQNKRICEIDVDIYSNSLKKLNETIAFNYRKAPFYEDVMPLLEQFFNQKQIYTSIGDMALQSIKLVANYLNINTNFEVSSKIYQDTQHLTKADRLIAISKKAMAETYINTIGGLELYDKKQFLNKGVILSFIKSSQIKYNQFDNTFVPNLSILDIIMFNSIEETQSMISQYELI